jgi:hypothetical protein
MFQLTKAEAEVLVSQNVIPSMRSLGGSLPNAFTAPRHSGDALVGFQGF